MVIPGDLNGLLESSEVVGNIRFSHPTLYVFPGGQGDSALFGINGFNMLGKDYRIFARFVIPQNCQHFSHFYFLFFSRWRFSAQSLFLGLCSSFGSAGCRFDDATE